MRIFLAKNVFSDDFGLASIKAPIDAQTADLLVDPFTPRTVRLIWGEILA